MQYSYNILTCSFFTKLLVVLHKLLDDLHKLLVVLHKLLTDLYKLLDNLYELLDYFEPNFFLSYTIANRYIEQIKKRNYFPPKFDIFSFKNLLEVGVFRYVFPSTICQCLY